jgi:hypothetical protein
LDICTSKGNWSFRLHYWLIQRSGCSLPKLRLGPLYDKTEEGGLLAEALESMSSLEYLLIDCNAIIQVFTDDVFKELTHQPYRGSATTILPNLRSLGIYLPLEAFDDEVFIDMIESRWTKEPQRVVSVNVDDTGPTARLHDITIKSSAPIGSSDTPSRFLSSTTYKRLQRLKVDGLKVKILEV